MGAVLVQTGWLERPSGFNSLRRSDLPRRDNAGAGLTTTKDEFAMASTGFRIIRDCVNPAVALECKGNDVVALHIETQHTVVEGVPPVVVVDGVRFVPEVAA